MIRTHYLFAASVLAFTAACAQTPPGDVNLTFPGTGSGGSGSSASTGGTTSTASGTGPAAQELYNSTVHEDLLVACGACHAEGAVGAPVVMDEDADASYGLLDGYIQPLIALPENSLLLLKGKHAGPALDETPGLEEAVMVWLTKEAEERGLEPPDLPADPPAGGTTFDTAMEAFMDCMRLDVWEGMGMGLVPLNQTQGDGPCVSCHNTGAGGLTLDDNVELTFNATKASKYKLQKYVAPLFDDDGNFEQLAMATRLREKGSELCPFENPDDCHPKYILEPANDEAIQGFVEHTFDAIAEGTCDEPYDDGIGGAGGAGGGGNQ